MDDKGLEGDTLFNRKREEGSSMSWFIVASPSICDKRLGCCMQTRKERASFYLTTDNFTKERTIYYIAK